MENIKSDKGIFEGFKPRIPLVLIFGLGLLLGSLTLIIDEVPAFSGAALFVIASLIFMSAREILPIAGIICPAIFAFLMTGSLSAPALYVGVIFTVGVTVYLTLGGRAWAPILIAGTAYAVGAVLLDPISALPALIPVAIGLLAALMLPRSGLTFTSAALTILALCAGLILFLTEGGDLAGTAEVLRTSISDLYASLSSEYLIIDRETADLIAAYIINLSPGFIFAAVSAVFFIALSLANTLFRASGLTDQIPAEMAKISLSPLSGIIYLFCFFLSAAFALEGADYELYAAVTENVIMALSLPFTVLGFRAIGEFISGRFLAKVGGKRRISALVLAFLFIASPSVGLAVFISAGVAFSLTPIYKMLFAKMRSKINK